MAVEKRRGCGFRKIGGLYLVSKGWIEPCHRLPIPLSICPTCNHGIKQTRGWTWINPVGLFDYCDIIKKDDEFAKFCCAICPACNPSLDSAGLLWIGEQFYKTTDDFMFEALTMGISRRIHRIPRGFELGKTWVYVAHPKTIRQSEFNVISEGLPFHVKGIQQGPGIFHAFRPQGIEYIIRQSDLDKMTPAQIEKRFTRRGITPVPVPDNDRDHAPKDETELIKSI